MIDTKRIRAQLASLGLGDRGILIVELCKELDEERAGRAADVARLVAQLQTFTQPFAEHSSGAPAARHEAAEQPRLVTAEADCPTCRKGCGAACRCLCHLPAPSATLPSPRPEVPPPAPATEAGLEEMRSALRHIVGRLYDAQRACDEAVNLVELTLGWKKPKSEETPAPAAQRAPALPTLPDDAGFGAAS